jgi:hypothetical protein
MTPAKAHTDPALIAELEASECERCGDPAEVLDVVTGRCRTLCRGCQHDEYLAMTGGRDYAAEQRAADRRLIAKYLARRRR